LLGGFVVAAIIGTIVFVRSRKGSEPTR